MGALTALAAHRRTAVASAWLRWTNLATVAALAGAALLAPTANASPRLVLALALFVGSSTHVAATGWLGGLGSVRSCARRHPVRFAIAPLCCVAAGAAAGAVTSIATLGFVLAGFFSWQFFHFTKQNLGIAALASTSHRAGSLRRAERRWLTASGVAGIIALLARPSLLQLHVRVLPPFLFAVAALGFAVCVVGGYLAYLRRPRPDRSSSIATSYGLGLGFSAPIFLFSSPYAAVAGMTIAHGLQYLGIVGLVAAGPSGQPRRSWRLVSLVNVALLGGLGLAAASHLHGDPGAGRVIFGAYLGILSAHFVIDAGLWRMSDPAARAFVTAALPDLVGAASTGGAFVRSTDRSGADIQ